MQKATNLDIEQSKTKHKCDNCYYVQISQCLILFRYRLLTQVKIQDSYYRIKTSI